MRDLASSVRHAVRRLARRPGFTVTAVVTLALGIGANVAIFSAVHAVLLEPLPYPEPERLVQVESVEDGSGKPTSIPDFVDLRDGADALSGLFALAHQSVTLSDGDRPAELVSAYSVTGDFFHVLGTSPALGRPFSPEELAAGADPVVLLGHDLWRRRYGADPEIVGRRVEADGAAATVVGVMPRGFAFPAGSEAWMPLTYGTEELGQRGSRYLSLYGRLAPGRTLDGAEAQAVAIASRLEAAHPETNAGHTFRVERLRDALVGEYRPALLMLLGAAGLVLLIACANVANLLLARMLERRRELAVRMALGAPATGVLRGVFAEALLVSAAGGVAALAVGRAGLELLTSFEALDVPRLSADLAASGLHPVALAFGVGLTLVTALAATSVPALRLRASRSLHAELVAGERSTGDRSSHRLRGALVVAEITLAVVLLFGAGLLGRSFLALRSVDPGFDPEGVLTFSMTLGDAAYPEAAQKDALAERLLERLERLPQVEEAGLVLGLPMGGMNLSFGVNAVDGRPASDALEDELAIVTRPVTPGYFRAMGIPLVAGRNLGEGDAASGLPDAPAHVLVNEAAARRLWPGKDPLGHTLTTGAVVDGARLGGTVVGVVGDVRSASPADAPLPELYVPYRALPLGFLTIVTRTAGDPARVVEPARAIVQELDPRLAISRVRTMEHILGETLAQSQLYALLLGLFAGTALLLAAVGIYGVVSQAASRRTREMGIRMALGATRRHVVALMLRQGLGMTALGAAAGLLAAVSLGGVLRAWLYGLEPTDPTTLAACVALLAAVTVLASLAPARRASHTDPVVTLKEE